MRLIDADKIIYTWIVDDYGNRHDGVTLESIINKMPTIEPEIVRCKDCKHWFDIDDGRQKHRMCADIYGDWFCADAERRTDE